MEPRNEVVVVDSSVWVALFIDGDSSHAEAGKIIDSLAGYIYVPYIVLSETATVITNKYSKEQANNFLHFISGDTRCTIVDNSYSTDMKAFLDCPEMLSFPDISIITFAVQHQAQLITFDRKMRKEFSRVSAV